MIRMYLIYLIFQALPNNKLGIKQGIKMTHTYFSSLNYSLGNEDTTFEVELCKRLRPKSILSVAGCGSRSLPLLACAPEDLYCIDLSLDQTSLTSLRLQTIKELSFEDFLKFWGFAPFNGPEHKDHRQKIFNRLDLNIEIKDSFREIFLNNDWSPLLYVGNWEKTFIVFSKVLKQILGQKNIDKLFSFTNLKDQITYYESEFPMKRWKFCVFILGNKKVFNKLLYKGHFIDKNMPESYFDFYFNAFDKLLRQGLARENFFLNLLFLGHIPHPEGNPVEAREDIFNEVKSTLSHSKVCIENQNLLGLPSEAGSFDFLSVSDVPSYFSGEAEKNFLSILSPHIRSGGTVVLRSYLRVPQVDTTGFEEITAEHEDLIENERFQMYRIQLFKKSKL